MQPFPTELEPPAADRAPEIVSAGTDIDADTQVPVAVARALTDVLLCPAFSGPVDRVRQEPGCGEWSDSVMACPPVCGIRCRHRTRDLVRSVVLSPKVVRCAPAGLADSAGLVVSR
jgi:hypothetical protein